VNFLSIASGSLTELDTHLVIANKLGYLNNETLNELEARMDEVGRMLTALRKSLEATRGH
jgi:four helix bundle protein